MPSPEGKVKATAPNGGQVSIAHKNTVGDQNMNPTYTNALFPFMKALTAAGQHISNKVQILAAHRYVSPRGRTITPAQKEVRHIAYALKNPSPEVAELAARTLAPILHTAEPTAERFMLMPVPASTGSTESNRRIAEALAAELRRHGRRVTVKSTVARRHPVESSCTRRRKGGRGLTLEQHAIVAINKPIPSPEIAYYFVDNMATEGTTLQACHNALGYGKAIVWADKQKAKA